MNPLPAVPPTQVAPTPLADFVGNVCKEVKTGCETAKAGRDKQFKDQSNIRKVAYYAANFIRVGGLYVGVAALAAAVVAIPFSATISLISLGVGVAALVARAVAAIAQKRFETITKDELDLVTFFTKKGPLGIENKDKLPPFWALRDHRRIYESLMEPINMSPMPACESDKKEWRTLMGLFEGKKAMQEAEKDVKQVTAGQDKLVRNIGTLYVTSLLLESIQHVVANRMSLAKQYAERIEKASVTSLSQELIDKINPLLAKLKNPTADFQEKVYKAITNKDPVKDLPGRIHQTLAPVKELPTFKLSDLDIVAGIAAAPAV